MIEQFSLNIPQSVSVIHVKNEQLEFSSSLILELANVDDLMERTDSMSLYLCADTLYLFPTDERTPVLFARGYAKWKAALNKRVEAERQA